MSANNQIIIYKASEYTWKIKHIDVDTGKNNYGKFPVCHTLEEAVRLANKFQQEVLEDGMIIEYGLKIILD